jgi:ABC-2 type transport system ATP-binding protein
MENPILKVTNLSKQYRSRKSQLAINGLNLSVDKGSLYGLIGPDGAGKSTTLRILATVIEPTSGEVTVNGFDVIKAPEKIRPHIGYMPQLFSLYPDLTVSENLNFFANINHVKKSEKTARIQKMLSFTNLSDFTDRRARNLSGGMKKKLVLACSLIHSPKILILDEPSTGVDPVSRRELWQMLSEVVAQGVTILVSTPYMDEAERCHEVAILYEGNVIAQGQPNALKSELPFHIIEVKAKPRNATRMIVGNQKNILDWRPVGDRFRIAVNNGNSAIVLKSLEKELTKNKADIRLIREVKPLMEDVFTYRVNALRTPNE